MNVREGELVWTKKEAVKSVLLFTLNFAAIVLIVGLRLLFSADEGTIAQTFRENRANYLYIIFCILLLVWIVYFYFFFENRRILTDGRSIALVFTVLDFSMVVSFLCAHLCPSRGALRAFDARPRRAQGSDFHEHRVRHTPVYRGRVFGKFDDGEQHVFLLHHRVHGGYDRHFLRQ